MGAVLLVASGVALGLLGVLAVLCWWLRDYEPWA